MNEPDLQTNISADDELRMNTSSDNHLRMITSADDHLRMIVREAISEYLRQDTARREPARKAELQEERRLCLEIEQRLAEMAAENQRVRVMAEEVQRGGAIRSELQRLGVSKIDLAFKLVQDCIVRAENGELMAGSQTMGEYLREFLEENPEFLPRQSGGGAGMAGVQKAAPANGGAVDLDKIGPAMSRDELERVREAIVRVGMEMNR